MTSIIIESVVKIEGLRLSAQIGCTAEEREHKQYIEIDLQLSVPTAAQAASSLVLNETVSYLTISNLVAGLVCSRPWVLVEELAAAIINMILGEFELVQKAVVEIKKFVLSDCRSAGLVMSGMRGL
jgi:dihydroneopterin aldolase